MDREELKTTGEGIALRAGLLAAGGLLVGAWLVTVMAKATSAAIHLLLVAGLGLLGAGYLTWKVKSFQLDHHTHEADHAPSM
jgi:hypothetical protein